MKSLFFWISTVLFTAGAFAQSNYVVLCSVSDTNNFYYQAADTLADYRNGQLVTFDASNVNALESVLENLSPDYVAVVLSPLELDINFVRRFLMLSTRLDNDPFSDFSYGYITGATGQDALDFVQNIMYAESQNIGSLPLNVGGYVASSLNQIYTFPSGWIDYLNPPVYQDMYLETNDNGIGHTYFLNNTSALLNKKLLDIGHNGDPHMIWLFEDGNSTTNPPVWLYDSTRIEDPAFARVGISSYDIDGLNLYPAVAFNGACHSGEPKRVMVEGDIAATFGDTDWETKFYTMSDTFSYALTLLKTGITGYFAPCGANNANDQGEEVYNAFLYQEPLGDIHKRTTDGVVMGFLGNAPDLKIYTDGEIFFGCDVWASGSFDPADWSGACYMLGGKANRIYFGDPMFDPFVTNHASELEIVSAVLDSVAPEVLDIQLMMDKPAIYFPLWDKFHFSDTRLYYPVELPSSVGDIQSFTVIDSSGPCHLVIHAEEYFRGKHFLHIEVDIPDDMYSAIQYDITFRIGFLPAGIQDVSGAPEVKVFPDPASDIVHFEIPSADLYRYQKLVIYTSGGQMIFDKKLEASSLIDANIGHLSPGLYFWQLLQENGEAVSGRFSVAR